MTPDTEIRALVERMVGLLAKCERHLRQLPWRVTPEGGYPCIDSRKAGRLFKGYIGAWPEAELAVEAVNAVPQLATALETLLAERVADREALRRIVVGFEAWKKRTPIPKRHKRYPVSMKASIRIGDLNRAASRLDKEGQP